MKKIENIIKSACVLTVLILTAFYLFAIATGYSTPLIDFGTFVLILMFGIIISAANLILGISSLKLAVRIAIHYLTLLVAFTVIFAVNGNLGGGNVGAVTAAIIVFSFLYAVMFPACYFAIKHIRAADQKLDGKVSARTSAKQDESKKKPKYEARYK